MCVYNNDTSFAQLLGFESAGAGVPVGDGDQVAQTLVHEIVTVGGGALCVEFKGVEVAVRRHDARKGARQRAASGACTPPKKSDWVTRTG